MNSLIRINTIINKTILSNITENAKHILNLIKQNSSENPDIILIGGYGLTGIGGFDLFKNKLIQNELVSEILNIAQHTKDVNSYIILSCPILSNDKIVETIFILYNGEVVDTIDSQDFNLKYFKCDDLSFTCVPSLNQNISNSKLITELLNSKPNLILSPSINDVTALSIEQTKQDYKYISKLLNCGIAVANGGINDTSSPYIYKGFSGIFELGETVEFNQDFYNDIISVKDIDQDILNFSSNSLVQNFDNITMYKESNEKEQILREILKNPFLSKCTHISKKYLLDLFELQAVSLANRIKNINCEKLVIGVSGGLDSSLALLVCAKTMDMLQLDRSNVLAITMPGFGTTGTTYQNAIDLINSLNVSFKEISIKDSVIQHFKDIEQDIENKDVTFENSQARERTQILLDMANKNSAIVVGTGDLSEDALGFCTFSGDHLSNFNVNVCVTKTMIRVMLDYLIKSNIFSSSNSILQDILDTPVSPELLPPDENGNIAQKTEEILGPYELHEFFLYYFLKYNFSPEKLYFYACKAFNNDLDNEFIKDKLKVFLKRFISSQFKRSCAPDSAILTDINLCNSNYFIASDADFNLFIKNI